MCELCKKQVASLINNRNADTILKMSQAATNLYSVNFTAEAKQVTDALVQLLPKEAKTSGEVNQPKDQAEDPEQYSAAHKLIARLLGVNPADVRSIHVA